ncbi:MAG TPA: DUF423 domain-containing protein [Bryobacteraceae bacterium]|nr:DUF423 domain-containing protein [Bryobacteraceae bacterium]
MSPLYGVLGALLLALGVGMGAFGAHALRGRLDAYSMGVWEKAVFYHLIHALGLLIVFLLARTGAIPGAAGNRVGFLLTAGILLFSGSLYVLALTGMRVLGAVTPLGGVAFLAAWLLLCVDLFRGR